MLLECKRSPTTRHSSSLSEPTLFESSAPVRPIPDPSEGSSNDEDGIHSERKSERGASGNSSGKDISDFNSEKALGISNDLVISLPLQS